MERNIFKLENDQLKEIALSLRQKVEEGLAKDGQEIQCIPTFITPKSTNINGPRSRPGRYELPGGNSQL